MMIIYILLGFEPTITRKSIIQSTTQWSITIKLGTFFHQIFITKKKHFLNFLYFIQIKSIITNYYNR
jgi:hypothetical protein